LHQDGASEKSSSIAISQDTQRGDRVEVTEESVEDDGSEELDILDYGVNVEMMDDCRRNVMQDIHQIRRTNKQIKVLIKYETDIETQIKKDVGHSKREMKSFVQGINSERAKGKTNRTFLSKFNNDFGSKMAVRLEKMRPSDTSSEPHPITPDTSTSRKKQSKAPLTIGDLKNMQRQTRIQALRKELLANVEKLEMGWDNIEKVRNERQHILRVMEQHDLKRTLERTRELVQRLREEDNEYENHSDRTLQLIAESKDRYLGLRRETNSKVGRASTLLASCVSHVS
jgi:hypothetical protein